jgi:predicted nuclease with TOPRIM domain
MDENDSGTPGIKEFDQALEAGVATIWDLQRRYIDVQRGIFKITAKLDDIRNLKNSDYTAILKDIDELNLRIGEITNRLETIPTLHRKSNSQDSTIKKLQRNLATLEGMLRDQDGDMIRLTANHNALSDIVDEIRATSERLTDALRTSELNETACRTRVDGFMTEFKDWREHEVKPALIKINRMWWTVLVINTLIGLATVAYPIVMAIVKRLNAHP